MSAPEVAIVGGGIAGCATAYYLGARGVACTLIERDAIAAAASGFAYGGLNPLTGAGIPGPMSPLADWAFELHQRLAEELAAADCAVGFRHRSTLQLAFSEAEAAGLAAECRRLSAAEGFHAQALDASAARRLEPRLAPDIAAALLVEGTAEVDASALTHALAAQSLATLQVGEAPSLVRCGERATGVRTDQGVVPCQAVVLATGPWRELCPALPIAPLKGEILRLQASGPPLLPSVGWGGNYATTKPDGLLWAGTTEEHAGFDAKRSAAAADAILARLRRTLPGLSVGAVARHTACLRPMPADGLAILGRLPQWSNVYVANGGGRKGVLYGPAFGYALTELIVDAKATHDLSPYSPGRFG